MANESTRISQLKEMLKLEEQRASLQSEIDQLDQHISALGAAVLAQPAAAPAAPAPAPAVKRGRPLGSPAKAPKITGKRQRRGGLKEKIMSALKAAGDKGIGVREIADALGTKPQNIYSWFNNTGKKNPDIKKVGQATYALQSAAGAAEPVAAAPAASPAKPGKAPKKSATPKKASAPAKSASPKKPKRGGSARGELREKILEALKTAGSQGISVKELSEKLGVNYKNISIWFSTTGRKHSEIKKVGPALYTID